METLGELVTETTRRLGVSTVSTYFTPTKITDAVKIANSWAVSLYEWPHLERAKIAYTQAGQYFVDYPAKLLTDSVTRVIVAGDLYELKSFDDFLNYKHQTSGTLDLKIASDWAKQLFLFPTPTQDDQEIIIFGLEEPTQMEESEDQTIFSASEAQGNEAIVKKALGILLPEANKKTLGQAEESEAEIILAKLYAKILKRQGRYQRLNRPQFDVPDMFAIRPVTSKSRIGNF